MVDERVDILDRPCKVVGLKVLLQSRGDHIGVGGALLNRVGHDSSLGT